MRSEKSRRFYLLRGRLPKTTSLLCPREQRGGDSGAAAEDLDCPEGGSGAGGKGVRGGVSGSSGAVRKVPECNNQKVERRGRGRRSRKRNKIHSRSRSLSLLLSRLFRKAPVPSSVVLPRARIQRSSIALSHDGCFCCSREREAPRRRWHKGSRTSTTASSDRDAGDVNHSRFRLLPPRGRSAGLCDGEQ